MTTVRVRYQRGSTVTFASPVSYEPTPNRVSAADASGPHTKMKKLARPAPKANGSPEVRPNPTSDQVSRSLFMAIAATQATGTTNAKSSLARTPSDESVDVGLLDTSHATRARRLGEYRGNRLD